MNVVFRTDASLDIGTGHVMRCLTLAEALRERGAMCSFICREHPGNLLDLIRHRGFIAHALPFGRVHKMPQTTAQNQIQLPHAAWLGEDWEVDARQSLSILMDSTVDWLIVDHYSLDDRWERTVRTQRRMMVIDDLADRRHSCDLLLDQNLGRNNADYEKLVPPTCKVLVGPQYALLRPEFSALRPYSLARRAASKKLKQLLITMGGVDKGNASCMVLDALSACNVPADWLIIVVMGLHAPWLAKVRAKAVQMQWPTEVLVNVQNMAKLVADSDLAIGAAGTSAWERCCLGLPTLTMVLADNQREGAVALSKLGAALVLRGGLELTKELIQQITLLSYAENLHAMQLACSSVTNGGGATSLATMIMNNND
jgi:UDP-2,4-diacetamido-2,4,6-trideoxy-beta-L-altropyranose hydrolase